MAYDIFLSYARQDTERARQIKDLLEGLGLNVFFDTEGLDGGDVFPDILDRELKTAGAIVGVWSKHALTRPWVKIECDIGKTRGVLVPLQIEEISDLDRPAAFWNIQFADLSDFDGDPDHVGWLRFIRALARTLDRGDLLERESAAQAAEPASDDAAVREELAALRAEMADMRNAKAELAAQVNQPAVAEVSATGLGVWQEIKDTGNPAAIRRFLETVRGTPLEHVVEAKLTALEQAEAAPSPAPTQAPYGAPPPSPRRKTPLVAGTIVLVAAAVSALVFLPGILGEKQTGDALNAAEQALRGADINPTTADTNSVAYHEQACADGVATACMSAATAYAYGEDGATKDQYVAMSYYDMGCNLGDMETCWVAGISAERAKDYDTARTYYDKACKGGAEDGCELLGSLEETQADQARENATIRLQQALINKDFMRGSADGVAGPATEQALGAFYLQSGSDQSPIRFTTASAQELNRIAAKIEEWQRPRPTTTVIPSWAQGLTDPVNQTDADNCIAGDMLACYNLGFAYHLALRGVRQNLPEAKRLYTKACNGGYEGACDNLERMDD